MRRFIATTRIGNRYGKAQSLMKKGDTLGAFEAATEALEMSRSLVLSDPEAIPLRIEVAILFGQLAVKLGRETDARNAAVETLNACAEVTDLNSTDDQLGRELETLRYYANVGKKP